MATLLPNVVQRFLDANGLPLVGGQLFSYAAGTSTPLATFTDAGGLTPNANPTILDSNGQASVWIGGGSYKFVLEDALNNVLWTVDNVVFIGNGSIVTAMLADGAVTTVKIAALAITTALIQDNAVTTSKIPDSAITTAKIPDAAITLPKLATSTDVLFKDQGPNQIGGGIRAFPRKPWAAPTLIANPTTLPGGNALNARWSHGGRFLAVPENTGSFASLYLRSTNTIRKLLAFDALPAVAANAATFAPNDEYLAFPHGIAPYLDVYQRTGNAFKRLFIYGTSPTGNGNAAEFSPSNEFLAVAHDTTPFMTVYQMQESSVPAVSARYTSVNGQTIANATATIVNFEVAYLDPMACVTIGASWQFKARRSNFYDVESMVTLAAATYTAGLICEIYLYLNGSLFSILDSQVMVAANKKVSLSGGDTIFLSAGDICAVVIKHNQSSSVNLDTTVGYNHIAVIERPGFLNYTAFSKISDPATLPAGNGKACGWSPDSQTLVIGHTTTPFMSIYSRSGTTLTKIADPSTLPAGQVNGAKFSPDGKYLALAIAVTPFVEVYSVSGTTYTKLADPATLPAGAATAVAWYPDTSILAVSHAITPFVSIYSFNGTTLTKQADASGLPAGDATGLSFTPDGQYLTISHANTPYITTYQSSGVIPTDAVLFVNEVNLV